MARAARSSPRAISTCASASNRSKLRSRKTRSASGSVSTGGSVGSTGPARSSASARTATLACRLARESPPSARRRTNERRFCRGKCARLRLASLATPTQHLLRYAAYLIVGEQQSAESASSLAGAEVAPYSWALQMVARPGDLGVPDDPIDALAAETSLPRWLAARWAEQLGPHETRELAAALNQRAPLTIRANLLKNTRDELRALLEAEGARVETTRWSPHALTFTGRTNVFALKAFKAGRFELQDEGSQLVAEACGARPGQLVVDACAGAGGKALALAAHMANRGKIVACDRDGRRLDEFRLRARRDGVHNWEARTVPEGASGEPRLDDLRDRADVVLVDAPCSGLGALRRNPDARWRMDLAEVDSFPPRQRKILDRYAAL